MKTIEVGDKVAYSVQWLESTGQSHGDLSRDRGVVTKLTPLGDNKLATVDWQGDSPGKVLVSSLAIVGPNTRFCKC